MRPIPKPRHWLFALLLAGMTAVVAFVAFHDDNFSPAQINLATVALKRHDPTLYRPDAVFGDSGLWRFSTPAFQGLMELVLAPTGYRDPMLPFRVLTPVLAAVYLAGMYALLYRQCRSASVSAFVAILSMTVMPTLGTSQWGMGVLATATPEGIILAIMPLVVLSYLHYSHDPLRPLLVFAFIGLMAMLNMAMAGNLTFVLLIAHLGGQGFRPRAWLSGAAYGVVALVMALPYLLYFLGMRSQFGSEGPIASAQTAYLAFGYAGQRVLYPGLLKAMLDWDLLLRLLVLVLLAASVLTGIERFRTRDKSFWLWMAAGAALVAFGLHGVSQFIGYLRGESPPVIDFYRAAGLLLLPLYVLMAQGLTNLFRLVRKMRGVLRWVLAAVLVAWMLPADNFRTLRHMAYERLPALADERMTELQEHDERQRALEAVGAWAAESTDQRAMFLVDQPQFRVLSRRSVLGLRNDVEYLYYLASHKLDGWMRRFGRQQQLLHPPGGQIDPAAIMKFIRQVGPDAGGEAPSQWYLVIRAGAAPPQHGELQPINSPQWDAFFRVYRVPMSPAAAAMPVDRPCSL